MAQGTWWKPSLGVMLVAAAFLSAVTTSRSATPSHLRVLHARELDPSRITISQQKLPVVQRYCPATAFVTLSQQEYADAVRRYDQLGGFFQFDDKLLKSILRRDAQRPRLGDYLTRRSVLFVLPAAIGVVLAAILFCCFVTCLCKPQNRPVLCWSLQGEPGSTNCFAVIALVLLVLVLLLAMVAAYISLSLRSNIKQSQCELSNLLNTVAYGGITRDHGDYFVGIRTAKQLISTSTNHVQNMVTNMTKGIEQSIVRIDQLADKVRSSMAYVADPRTPNQTFALTYYLPVPSVQQLESKFGGTLGSPSHPFSLLGGMYLLMKTADIGTAIMSKIQHAIEQHRSKLDDKLLKVDGLLAREQSAFDRTLERFTKVMSLADLVGGWGSTVAAGLFVCLAVSCVGGIIASACYMLFGNASWKHCLFTLLITLGVLSILTFLVSLASTLALPALYAGCKPFRTGLNTPADFRATAVSLGIDSRKATVASKCFGDGNADFLKEEKRQKLIRRLGMATQLLKVSDLVTNAKMGFLSAAAEKLRNYINRYYSAERVDIGYDYQVAGWFRRLADHSEMVSVCSEDHRYHADRLVASANYEEAGCPGAAVQCKNFGTCPSGCIDLTATMLHYGSSKQWLHAVRVRYGTSDCGYALTAVLGALYNNWHRPRIDSDNGIGGVKKRFEEGPLANIALIDKTIEDFKQRVRRDVDKLRDLSSRAINGENGVLTVGTNCRVIGQKAITARDATCYRAFNGAYRMWVISLAVSAMLLLTLPILVCAFIRHEQSELGGSKLDGQHPCCCCPCGSDGSRHRSSYPDELPLPDPFPIERIQSGIVRYSGSPSTAMNSNLYPIRESGAPEAQEQRRTNLSWLNTRHRNPFNSLPRINQ